MSLKPFNDRILIYQTKAPDNFTSTDGVSKSKIIIPDEIKKKNQPNTGMILAVGEVIKEKYPDLKLGQVVLFEKWCGADVELLNNNGVVMKDLKMVKYEDLISSFVDDGYFYDDLLAPIREEEAKAKLAEEETQRLLLEQKQKNDEVSESDSNMSLCEIQCQECGLKEEVKLKWLNSFAVDDSNLPECSACKKKSMKVNKKSVNSSVRV